MQNVNPAPRTWRQGVSFEPTPGSGQGTAAIGAGAGADLAHATQVRAMKSGAEKSRIRGLRGPPSNGRA